jgi:hypothetical protein
MLKNAICSGKRTVASIVPIVWQRVPGRFHQEEIFLILNLIGLERETIFQKGIKAYGNRY